MKHIFVILPMLLLTGCGYSSLDNEVTGQVKRVMNNTPIICSDFSDADVSLGVMRNGVGSMSTQDVWINVPTPELMAKFKHAAEVGSIVKIKYNQKRIAICKNSDKFATEIEEIN